MFQPIILKYFFYYSKTESTNKYSSLTCLFITRKSKTPYLCNKVAIHINSMRTK